MRDYNAYKIELFDNKLKCTLGFGITATEVREVAVFINKNIPIGSLVKISNLKSNRPPWAVPPIIFFNACYADNYIEITCYYKKRQYFYVRDFEITRL